MTRRLVIAVLALTAALAVPLIIGRGNLFDRLTDMPGGVFLWGIALAFGAWLCTAARLLLLMRATGYRLSPPGALGTAIATEFAVIATPGGSGGPVAQAMILKRRGIPASAAVALYTFDHVIDALFFLCAVPALALTLATGPTGRPGDGLISDGLVMVALLIIGVLLLMALGLRFYRPLLLRTGPLLNRLRLSRQQRHRIARGVIRFRQALRTAGRMPWPRLVLLILFCVGQWVSRYSVLVIITTTGLGLVIPVAYLFAIQLIGLGVGQASMIPGGGGSADLSIGALLAPFADGASIAAALLAWRMTTTYFQLAAGGLLLPLMLRNDGHPRD